MHPERSAIGGENIKKSNNDLEWLNWVLDGHIFSYRWLRIYRFLAHNFDL